MSKFKIGDRVVITQKTETNTQPTCVEEMVAIARENREHIVAGQDWGGYVKLEGMRWVWNENWLEHTYEIDSL